MSDQFTPNADMWLPMQEDSYAAANGFAPAAATQAGAAWPNSMAAGNNFTTYDKTYHLHEAPGTPHGGAPPPPPKRAIRSSSGGGLTGEVSPAAHGDAPVNPSTLIALPSESSLLHFSNHASSHGSMACDTNIAGSLCDRAGDEAKISDTSPGNLQHREPAGITAQRIRCLPVDCQAPGFAGNVPPANAGIASCDSALPQSVAADANRGSCAAPAPATTRLVRRSSHGSAKRQHRAAAPPHPAQNLVEIGLASLAASVHRRQHQEAAAAALPLRPPPIRIKVQAADVTLAKGAKPDGNMPESAAGGDSKEVVGPPACEPNDPQDGPLPGCRMPVLAAELPKLYTPRSMASAHPLRALFGDAELKVYQMHLRADVRGPEASPII